METSEKNDQLEFSVQSKHYLNDARKWARFLAILGFIGVAIMVIMGLVMGMVMNSFGPGTVPGMGGMPFPPVIFSIIYFIVAVIYFFPVLYLFRFTTHIQKALTGSDSSRLSDAFRNLKAHYQFIGIIAIILIGIYIIGALMMGGSMLLFR